jgi:hypothetical protein
VEIPNCVPLRRVNGDMRPKGAGTSAPLTFRGKPIAWAMVPAIRKTILPNAFGEDEVLEEQSGAKHLIAYDGKQ